jgi:hypothetical protein
VIPAAIPLVIPPGDTAGDPGDLAGDRRHDVVGGPHPTGHPPAAE